jgi:hypothetical protein
MTQWQPIETAPKDGTEIIVWDAEYRHSYFARCNSKGEVYWDELYGPLENATHWMPLPEPPKVTE